MAREAQPPPYEWAQKPPVGALLFDSQTESVGFAQWRNPADGRYWLRPPGGGYEWSARLESLYPADEEQTEAARARLAAIAVPGVNSPGNPDNQEVRAAQ